MTHLKRITYASTILGMTSLFPNVVKAQDTVNILTGNTNYTFVEGLTPSLYITTAINLLLGGAGVAAFIFLLIGGVQWISAGSDKDAVEKARKKIASSLIGLAVVFSAYVLLYIVRLLFNVDLIGFNLGRLGT